MDAIDMAMPSPPPMPPIPPPPAETPNEVIARQKAERAALVQRQKLERKVLTALAELAKISPEAHKALIRRAHAELFGSRDV